MDERAIENVLDEFERIYSELYDAERDAASDYLRGRVQGYVLGLAAIGTSWIDGHPQEYATLVDAREDYFMSDREVAALALAVLG